MTLALRGSPPSSSSLSPPLPLFARFDDAFDTLQRAARVAPNSAEVLYRAGVCAINQGRWSRYANRSLCFWHVSRGGGRERERYWRQFQPSRGQILAAGQAEVADSFALLAGRIVFWYQ